jgi:DNA-binding transcriptional LysR family regulator
MKYLPHPVKLPEIALNLFWHARRQREPANQWLRKLIIETLAE